MKLRRLWLVVGSIACGMFLATFVVPGDGRAQDKADGADDADDADSEWPRELDAPNATIVVYQPQLDGYEGGVIEAHAALAITRSGETEPVFGAAWFKAKMQTDRESRMCDIYDVEVPKARFPGSTQAEEKDLADLIEKAAPGWVHPISMDRLLPELEAVEKARANDERLNNDAPRIVVETVPALLVPIDGAAKLGPVAGSRIQRVVNTPVALLFEPMTKTYWIDAGASWIYSSNVDGPYRAADSAPPEVEAVKTSNSTAAATKPGAAPGAAPKIVVSHDPTELVAFDGAPQWKPVVSDELSYAANTSTAVFATKSEGRFYVLLSGRWYRAASLETGPWEFVSPDQLPEVFREIPEDSEVGGVLAHVAGTDLAEEAVLDAQIPQTTAVLRAVAACNVVYDGAPQFDQVAVAGLKYAVNTASQVLFYKDAYYCCDQGVWFTSPSATGPWTVADSVPTAFQQIPPENPCYNTKYVYVYDSTPDVVYVGYTPGYLGWYCWDGTVVWGTGARYSGWSGGVWHPRNATWGVSVGYNAWSGRWYEGLSLRSGGGWSIGVGSFGDGGFGGAWWGPGGYRRWHHADVAFNRPVAFGRTFDRGDAQGARRRPVDVYHGARNRARNAPDRLASRPMSRLPARSSTPAAPGVARTRNDTFADRDGQIYRRGRDGAWQVRGGKTWRPAPAAPSVPRAPTPAPPRRVQRSRTQPAPTPQLGRDAWARDRGSERSRGAGRGARGGGGDKRK